MQKAKSQIYRVEGTEEETIGQSNQAEFKEGV